MNKCDFNCDDCKEDICLYQEEMDNLDDDAKNELKLLLNLALRVLSNPKNYES